MPAGTRPPLAASSPGLWTWPAVPWLEFPIPTSFSLCSDVLDGRCFLTPPRIHRPHCFPGSPNAGPFARPPTSDLPPLRVSGPPRRTQAFPGQGRFLHCSPCLEQRPARCRSPVGVRWWNEWVGPEKPLSLSTFQAGAQILRAGSDVSPGPEAGGAARGMAGDGGWSEKQAASNSGEPPCFGVGGT